MDIKDEALRKELAGQWHRLRKLARVLGMSTSKVDLMLGFDVGQGPWIASLGDVIAQGRSPTGAVSELRRRFFDQQVGILAFARKAMQEAEAILNALDLTEYVTATEPDRPSPINTTPSFPNGGARCQRFEQTLEGNFVCMNERDHEGPCSLVAHDCPDCGTRHGVCRQCGTTHGESHSHDCPHARAR